MRARQVLLLVIPEKKRSYHIATGADDHQIKIWDLRYRKELYTLPAHNNLISTVKFEPNHGRFLLSSSFDNTVKV